MSNNTLLLPRQIRIDFSLKKKSVLEEDNNDSQQLSVDFSLFQRLKKESPDEYEKVLTSFYNDLDKLSKMTFKSNPDVLKKHLHKLKPVLQHFNCVALLKIIEDIFEHDKKPDNLVPAVRDTLEIIQNEIHLIKR